MTNNKKIGILDQDQIKNKIHTIRGFQVMLDRDLAQLYRVETKSFNQAVKRNSDLFPADFMFRLSPEEFENLRSQIVTSSWGGLRYAPFVFTEQGVAMLSGILKSPFARQVNIKIMRTFVEMRRFLATNAQVFQRLDRVEYKQLESDKKFERIFEALEKNELKPQQGIFFDGQIFDAYVFVCDLIKQAQSSLVVIDNYVDASVLLMLAKRKAKVQALVLTNKISEQLQLDLKKHNSEYPKIEIKEFTRAHDRFIILDNKEVYHIGASLKDLGKKWFAFSRIEKESLKIIDEIKSYL